MTPNKGVQGTLHKVSGPLTPDVGKEEMEAMRERYWPSLLLSLLLTGLATVATAPLKGTPFWFAYDLVHGQGPLLYVVWFIGFWSLLSLRNSSLKANSWPSRYLLMFLRCLMPLAAGTFVALLGASAAGNEFGALIEKAEEAIPTDYASIKGAYGWLALMKVDACTVGIIGSCFCLLGLLPGILRLKSASENVQEMHRTYWPWVFSLCVAALPYAILALNPDLKMGFLNASSWNYDTYIGRATYYLNDRSIFFFLMLFSGILNMACLIRLAARGAVDERGRRIYLLRSTLPLLLGWAATLMGYRRSWDQFAGLLGGGAHASLYEMQAITQRLFGLANQALLIGIVIFTACFWMALKVPNATLNRTRNKNEV